MFSVPRSSAPAASRRASAVAVAGATQSRRIVEPLHQVLAASERLAAGQYHERLTPRGSAELAQLAAQFNAMAAALEGAERRRTALIGDVAHELRTPLATITGYAEGVLDGVVLADDATWALVHDEARRLGQLAAPG